MKKASIFLAALICLLTLAGCSCDHEWQEATCTTPRTCALCGEAEGDVLGHDWNEATCTTAKSCRRCGRISGDPLGHDWAEVTCTDPKTCRSCGIQLGTALGHNWVEATTQAPKTCTNCGLTEGERILTDPRFTTDSTKDLWGRWEADISLSEADLSAYHYNSTLEGKLWLEFDNAGHLQTGFVLKDEEIFRKAMAEYHADFVYDKAEEDELDEDTVNIVSRALLGVGVEEYMLNTHADTPVEELIEQLLEKSRYGGGWLGSFVYCVQDGKLYVDREWTDALTEVPFEFIGSTLFLKNAMEFKAADPA